MKSQSSKTMNQDTNDQTTAATSPKMPMDRATIENLAEKHGTPPPPPPVEFERLNWILACHLCSSCGMPFPPMPPHIREEGESEPAAFRKADSTLPKIPAKAYAVKSDGGNYQLKVCTFEPTTGEPVEFCCSLNTESQRTAAALSEAILGGIATDESK